MRCLQTPGATPLNQYFAFTGVKIENKIDFGQKSIWWQHFKGRKVKIHVNLVFWMAKRLPPDEFLPDFNIFSDFNTSKRKISN